MSEIAPLKKLDDPAQTGGRTPNEWLAQHLADLEQQLARAEQRSDRQAMARAKARIETVKKKIGG